MGLFPASTNGDYWGSRLSAWFLVVCSALTIVPGCIHYFLPDGGAGTIAHIDLSSRAETIIAIFAWYGALQIPFGLLQLIVGLRYRTLVPLMLAAMIVQQGLSAFSAWLWKGSHGGHHPPEAYGSVAFVVLGAVFLGLALRSRSDETSPSLLAPPP